MLISSDMIRKEFEMVRTDRTKELELNSEDLNVQANIITYIYKQMTKNMNVREKNFFPLQHILETLTSEEDFT